MCLVYSKYGVGCYYLKAESHEKFVVFVDLSVLSQIYLWYIEYSKYGVGYFIVGVWSRLILFKSSITAGVSYDYVSCI